MPDDNLITDLKTLFCVQKTNNKRILRNSDYGKKTRTSGKSKWLLLIFYIKHFVHIV